MQQRLGFLPEDKRLRLAGLQQRCSELERQIYANSHGLTTPDDQAALTKLHQQKADELASLLTPQERFELDLRASPTAQRLRSELAAFQPSEAEFRAIYEAQALADRRNQPGDAPAGGVAPNNTAAGPEQDLATRLKGALGDQRYAEYQRAMDPDYQNLLRIVERYGLSSEVAPQVFALKQNLESQSRQLLAAPDLDKDQRMLLLQGLRQQSSAAVAGLLGQKGLDVYRDRGGAWLGQTPPP
jgi:hypothetical protein